MAEPRRYVIRVSGGGEDCTVNESLSADEVACLTRVAQSLTQAGPFSLSLVLYDPEGDQLP